MKAIDVLQQARMWVCVPPRPAGFSCPGSCALCQAYDACMRVTGCTCHTLDMLAALVCATRCAVVAADSAHCTVQGAAGALCTGGRCTPSAAVQGRAVSGSMLGMPGCVQL